MTDLPTLIARLEAAPEGSRELDTAICMEHVKDCSYAEEQACPGLCNSYTTRLDAAMTLIHKPWAVCEIGQCGIWEDETYKPWRAILHKDGEEGFDDDVEAWGDTPALALCAAALRARGET